MLLILAVISLFKAFFDYFW